MPNSSKFKSSSFIPNQYLRECPVFDSHTHTLIFQKGRLDRHQVVTDLERGLMLGRNFGIGRRISLGGFSLYDNNADVRRVNELTAYLQNRFSGKFWGYAYMNPLHGLEATRRELDMAIERDGLIGIKNEIECNCLDPLYQPLLDKARSCRIPILQHTWKYHVINHQRVPLPSDIAEIARRNPDVTFIMAHLTGFGIEGLYAIEPLGNVLIDTSGAAPHRGYLKAALRIIGAERILYGSDAPGRGYPGQLARILSEVNDKEDLERILWKNIEKLHAKHLYRKEVA